MLASDLANKDFEGAKDPDSLLHVEFYWHEPIDKWESEAKGRIVKLSKRPYVRIIPGGRNDLMIDTEATDLHKARFPKQWMSWQMREGLLDSEHDIPGWKIEEWSEITQDQLHELKYLRFSTVEQIAGASDMQVQRMGMGGLALREKAKTALRNKMGAETRAEMEAKDRQIGELESRLARMEAMLLQPASPPSADKPKRRYRRRTQAAEQKEQTA